MTIHALHGGGAERVFSQLAARWAEAGHEVHVITWSAAESDPRPLPTRIQRHGLDLLRPSRNAWQAMWAHVRRIRSLRRTLRELAPAVVLSFCDQMNISTLRATRGLDMRVWIAERSDPARQRLSPWWEHWRRQNYPHCTGCVVQTEQIAQHLSQLIPRQRVLVIPNAVVIPRRSESGNTPPAIAHQPGAHQTGDRQPQVVLSIGRLAREKGVDVLLEAWRLAQPQLDGWQLHVAGDGPLRTSLEQQSVDLPAVKFLGWLPDPSVAYATSNLFVLPSRYEGFPNALLEAMSHGLPCIATRCTQAVEELARGGNSIVTVAADAPDSLAKALVELARAPARCRELGEAARRVSQEYTWSRIGPLWDRLLTP